MTDTETARMHIAQAYTRSKDPQVDRHLSAALAALDGERVEDCLVECPVCHSVGLPEQIACHDCQRR